MPEPMEIKLEWPEFLMASFVGAMRRVSAIKKGRVNKNGKASLDRWGMDIEGCVAEIAVAKAVNNYWHSLSLNPQELPGDVGTIQVRHTWRDDGHLIVQKDDKDDAPFVLVTGTAPSLTIRGFILGHEAKQERYWREDTGRPAYFVPQSELKDIRLIEKENNQWSESK